MSEERLPRKLAAILYADVVGYSRLTGADEDATHRRLSEYLDLVAEGVESNQGSVIHYAGDAVFGAVVDALSAAISIQETLRARNEPLPEDRRVRFRIGVNLGNGIGAASVLAAIMSAVFVIVTKSPDEETDTSEQPEIASRESPPGTFIFTDTFRTRRHPLSEERL